MAAIFSSPATTAVGKKVHNLVAKQLVLRVGRRRLLTHFAVVRDHIDELADQLWGDQFPVVALMTRLPTTLLATALLGFANRPTLTRIVARR